MLEDFNWVNVLTTTLEPCVGDGSLAKQLPGMIIGCDLIDRGYPGVIVGDYLKHLRDLLTWCLPTLPLVVLVR